MSQSSNTKGSLTIAQRKEEFARHLNHRKSVLLERKQKKMGVSFKDQEFNVDFLKDFIARVT